MFRSWPLLLILFPVLELYVLITVGGRIGALNTIALVILSTMAGLALLRLRGARILSRFQEEAARGCVPSSPLMDTLGLMAAGWLFLFPGFVSDILALLLLIPATRHGLASLLRRRMESGLFRGTVHTHYARRDENGNVTWTCSTTSESLDRQEIASRNNVIIDCEPEHSGKNKDSGTPSTPGPGGEGGH